MYWENMSTSFLPELKQFLIDNKKIYTVRGYRLMDGIITVEGVKDRKFKRTFLTEVSNSKELIPYYCFSGFSCVNNWWKKIKTFIPQPGRKKYLYLIEEVVQ